MAANDFNMHCINFASTKFTAGEDLTTGDMRKIQSAVGIIVEDALNTEEAVLVYSAEKITVPKTAATGITFAIGDPVYFDDTAKAITNSAGGNTICGRALEAALATDETALIDLKGNVAA